MNESARLRLDDLESKKADLEISIARESIAKTPLSKEQIVFWISKFKHGDISDRRYCQSIVDIFVNSVFLNEDKLVLTFNWKDGSRTVTLKDLTAAETPDSSGSSCSFLGDYAAVRANNPNQPFDVRLVGSGFGFVLLLT